jgi:hypothetical protein
MLPAISLVGFLAIGLMLGLGLLAIFPVLDPTEAAMIPRKPSHAGCEQRPCGCNGGTQGGKVQSAKRIFSTRIAGVREN